MVQKLLNLFKVFTMQFALGLALVFGIAGFLALFFKNTAKFGMICGGLCFILTLLANWLRNDVRR